MSWFSDPFYQERLRDRVLTAEDLVTTFYKTASQDRTWPDGAASTRQALLGAIVEGERLSPQESYAAFFQYEMLATCWFVGRLATGKPVPMVEGVDNTISPLAYTRCNIPTPGGLVYPDADQFAPIYFVPPGMKHQFDILGGKRDNIVFLDLEDFTFVSRECSGAYPVLTSGVLGRINPRLESNWLARLLFGRKKTMYSQVLDAAGVYMPQQTRIYKKGAYQRPWRAEKPLPVKAKELEPLRAEIAGICGSWEVPTTKDLYPDGIAPELPTVLKADREIANKVGETLISLAEKAPPKTKSWDLLKTAMKECGVEPLRLERSDQRLAGGGMGVHTIGLRAE